MSRGPGWYTHEKVLSEAQRSVEEKGTLGYVEAPEVPVALRLSPSAMIFDNTAYERQRDAILIEIARRFW